MACPGRRADLPAVFRSKRVPGAARSLGTSTRVFKAEVSQLQAENTSSDSTVVATHTSPEPTPARYLRRRKRLHSDLTMKAKATDRDDLALIVPSAADTHQAGNTDMTAFFAIAAGELVIYLGAAWWFRQAHNTPPTDGMPRTRRRWHAVLGVDTVTAPPRKVLP
ncbi:twin-arginine translocase TatA/TatE family subunit [Nocardia sp. NPDC059239]|uniref:twin-arginine translocase TatA/TatE family subunit n=1 Tax=Nocardia sp. NPDC059239 TaxID=3346785 RepID=UPI0036A22492